MLATVKQPYPQTGGVSWHWRAWRKRAQWRSFQQWVGQQWYQKNADGISKNTDAGHCDASFRNTAAGSRRELIMLGPSAGWTLPDDILDPFTHITCVDMDPLAPLFFRLVHKKSETTRHGQHAQTQPARKIAWLQQDFMTTLSDVLAQWPHATLLFANSLGQQGLLHDTPETTETLFSHLKTQLKGRCWFSYHDRLSLHFESPPAQNAINELLRRSMTLESNTTLSSEDLMQQLQIAQWAAELNAPRKPLHQARHTSQTRMHITDHLTGDILPPGSRRRYSLLPVTDKALHIVEAGWAV